MKCIVAVIFLSLLTSCHNYEDEVNNAVVGLEWIDNELDSIGERNIKGYSRFLLLKESEEVNPTDTIKLTVEEFRNIQLEIFGIIKDLEQLSSELRNDYETE